MSAGRRSTCASRRSSGFGSTRADIGVDIANLLNTNYATTWDNTYQYSIGNTASGGTWDNPTAIYAPRFVRLNFTVSF